MQFGKTVVLAAILVANLEHATGAEKKAVVAPKKNANAKKTTTATVTRRRATTAANAAAESTTDEAQARPHKAAESSELESIGEDIALLKLDDKVYWNRFLQRDMSMPSAMPSAMPSSSPTAATGGSQGGGSQPGGGDNKSGKRRALADARGKLILDNIKQNRKKARNGAKTNDWDNNFF